MESSVLQWWAGALRGNEYERGEGFLSYFKDEKLLHCPLGVLTRGCEKAGVIAAPRLFGGLYYAWPTQFGSISGYENGMLNREVREWADLREPIPVLELTAAEVKRWKVPHGDLRRIGISILNDVTLMPWDTLAGMIEDQLR